MTIITKLIKVTAGGNHGWYESVLDYPVRKPLGSPLYIHIIAIDKAKTSLWRKLIQWVKGLWKGKSNANNI